MRLILSVLLLLLKVSASASPGSEKKCQEKCGDIEIKPPFGLTEGCFRPGFRLICNKIQKARLFLGNEGASNIEVTSISFNPPRLHVQYYPIASSTASNSSWELLKTTPYTFSSDPDDNRFTVFGCDALAELVDLNGSSSIDKRVTSACSAICQSDDNLTEAISDGCHGIGCCQMLSPKGLKSYQILFKSLNNLNASWKWRNSTSWAFVGQLNYESISYVYDMMDAIPFQLKIDYFHCRPRCFEIFEVFQTTPDTISVRKMLPLFTFYELCETALADSPQPVSSQMQAITNICL